MALLLSYVGVDAQNYRKWDFTNWSATTVNNLVTDAAASSTEGWSDIEKADDAGPGKVAPEATAGKCFWEASMQGTSEGATLKANGAVIDELEGLFFVHTDAKRNLALAVNYPSTSLGTYHGGSYLWLGGATKNYFIIPNVKPGQPIKMGVESHKPADARGVELYIYKSDKTKGDKLTAPDGTTVAVPKEYTEQEWAVPSSAEGQNDEGNYDILVYNTNGCHIYFIEVGSSDQKSKIAYLYQGVADGALAVAQGIENYEVEAIDVASASITADQLKTYDAIVVAANIAADNAAAAAIKEAIAWTPIVNMNAALYAAWGLGEATTTDTEFLKINEANNSLLKGIELTEDEAGMLLFAGGNVAGITLGDYFKNDIVPATVLDNETLAGIHIHNNGHNSYAYVPFSEEASDEAKALLANAISAAANSKANITETPAPTFTLTYKNMETEVSIKDANSSAAIYYTTDGSAPTEASTPYTEPIVITTAGTTVKAVAVADGYLLSSVAEKAVDLKQQAAAPSIIFEKNGSTSTVTITADEGDIWYSFTNTNDSTKAAKYQGPVVVKYPRTIYAFVAVKDKVNSEVASTNVEVENFQPRIDILAHMDANKEKYYEKGNKRNSSSSYYGSWGHSKTTYPYYNLEAGYEDVVESDPETGDETTVRRYKELNPEESVDFEDGWMVRSRGQLVSWESLKTGTNYGDKSGYNYATPDDVNPYFPVTDYDVTLADKNTNPDDVTFPYNAYLVTTAKYQGPFDIVVNIASINKPEDDKEHAVVIQTATDGNVWESNWQTAGDTIYIKNMQRLTQNMTRSYEGTDEVYVRVYLSGLNSKVGFYDIYIANQGEKSQALMTGISEQVATPVRTTPAIYGVNGMRQQGMKRGLNIVVDEQGQAKKIFVQ